MTPEPPATSATPEVPGRPVTDVSGPDLVRFALDQARDAARRRPPTPEERSEASSRRAAARRSRNRGKDGTDPVPFGAAITELVGAKGWEGPARVATVLGRWPELVGADIADHCAPVSLRAGELVIQAESTAWATQLRLMGRQIQGRINAELGAATVTKVRVSGPTSAAGPRRGGWKVSGGRGPRDTYG